MYRRRDERIKKPFIVFTVWLFEKKCVNLQPTNRRNMMGHLVSLLCSILLTFVELNCENLFDCRDDSLKQDEEWLPESPRHWNEHRYWQKLDHIGQEIIACGEENGTWDLPDLVALTEVENDSVMRDLTKRSLLRQAGYRYVMTDSPDLRGVDVALMYNPFTFLLLDHYSMRITPRKNMRPTRDILYAKGKIITGDTLHVFVVHAPSRYGGVRATRPNRLLVANRLCESIDSIRMLNTDARIIVAGDFNDGWNDASPRLIYRHGMVNISKKAKGRHGARGTYKFGGSWESIDHIIVSEPMARRTTWCRVFDEPFVLEDDRKNGGVIPRRNYIGYRHNEGYSDHLPLVARFEL